MIKIKDRTMVPRGLFNYTVPETNRRFSANTLGLVVSIVTRHMTANGITVPPDLATIIENDYCQRKPEYCHDETNPKRRDDLLTRLAAHVAIPASDALARISGALGIKCAACQKRHEIIRRVEEIGFDEAVKQIRATF